MSYVVHTIYIYIYHSNSIYSLLLRVIPFTIIWCLQILKQFIHRNCFLFFLLMIPSIQCCNAYNLHHVACFTEIVIYYDYYTD